MRKCIAIIVAIVVMLLNYTVFANESIITPIELCVQSDVYSVDFVFGVSEDADISSVEITDENCMADWNYLKSEARLYISLASAMPIKKHKVIANLVSNKKINITALSVMINGKSAELSCLSHGTETEKTQINPTYDTPGEKGGKICSVCGAILKEHDIQIPPTGPVIAAVKDNDGKIKITGGISDSETTQNTVILGIYDDKKMLKCMDISSYKQNNFDIEIEYMQNADTVKIFRWNSLAGLKPLYDLIEVAVRESITIKNCH